MRTATSPRALSGCMAPLALAVLVLAGCGDDAATYDSSRGSSASTQDDGTADESDYVGLDKDEAIARAESEGRLWRIGREDDELFALTNDFVADRVTFEIDDGKVTTATFG